MKNLYANYIGFSGCHWYKNALSINFILALY